MEKKDFIRFHDPTVAHGKKQITVVASGWSSSTAQVFEGFGGGCPG